MGKQLRVELYIGWSDEPKAYDSLKLRLNSWDMDELKEKLGAYAEGVISELEGELDDAADNE